jgi:AAA family ATP:ADP antiporter
MNDRFRSLLTRLGPLRPGEMRQAGYLSAHFFFLMASIYVSKVSKTSLFLGLGLTKSSLPLVYLISAVLTGLFAAWNTKRIRSLDRRAYIAWSQMFFAVGTVAFWFLFGTGLPVISALYWFWFEILLLASVTQFWVVVGDICEPRRAKRLVSFFVSGGLLGGIFGSALVTVLSRYLTTRDMILLGLAFFLIGTGFMRASIRISNGPPAGPKTDTAPDYWEGFRTVARNPYLRLLSGLIVAALTVSTMIDFQFNLVIKAKYVLEAERTAFLGKFSVIVLVVSWLLNSLLANRAIRTLGVRTALFVTPLLLALGSAAAFIVPMAGLTAWAVSVKGADKSLTHTFSQATRELLYMPIPPELKAKAKMTIDMFVSKSGEALAGALQMFFVLVLAFEVKEMSYVTIAVVALWLLILVRIGRRYIPAIRDNLLPSRPDAEQVVREQSHPGTARRLLDLLESRERSSVLYAYNLFDLLKVEKLTPELRQILSDKSAEMRACSIDTLLDAHCESLGPNWDDQQDGESLDATVREVLALDSYQDVMRQSFEEISTADEAASEVDRMEVAKALGMMPADAPLTENLALLLKHESPGVVHYALESAARLRKREFLPLIIPHLGRPSVHDRAVETLEAYGDRAVTVLRDWLADFRADLRIRRETAETLAVIGTQKAADALLRQLRRRDPEVASATIEALYKIRSRRSSLRIPEREIRPEIFARVKVACLEIVGAASSSIPDPERNTTKMSGHLAPGFREIFLLLGLIYPPEDIARALQNYSEGTKRAVDYALELLENVLSKDLKDAVLPVLEDAPAEEKARSGRRILKALG